EIHNGRCRIQWRRGIRRRGRTGQIQQQAWRGGVDALGRASDPDIALLRCHPRRLISVRRRIATTTRPANTIARPAISGVRLGFLAPPSPASTAPLGAVEPPDASLSNVSHSPLPLSITSSE